MSAEETTLCDAAGVGNDEEVRTLLAQGTDANAADARGWMPLMAAAAGGHASTAKLLLAAGAGANAADARGRTALMWAAADTVRARCQ
jgi:ankyrin repeat protein